MKGFFAGALFAAPVTAIVMWWVMGWQTAVDTRIERAETRATLERTEMVVSMDQRWAELGGQPIDEACTPDRAAEVEKLRAQVAALEVDLGHARAEAATRAANLDDIVSGKKGDQE